MEGDIPSRSRLEVRMGSPPSGSPGGSGGRSHRWTVRRTTARPPLPVRIRKDRRRGGQARWGEGEFCWQWQDLAIGIYTNCESASNAGWSPVCRPLNSSSESKAHQTEVQNGFLFKHPPPPPGDRGTRKKGGEIGQK